MKVLAWYVLAPNGIDNKSHVKYPYSTSTTKCCKILSIDTEMVSKADGTRPTSIKTWLLLKKVLRLYMAINIFALPIVATRKQHPNKVSWQLPWGPWM
jgi:hypothetical protein